MLGYTRFHIPVIPSFRNCQLSFPSRPPSTINTSMMPVLLLITIPHYHTLVLPLNPLYSSTPISSIFLVSKAFGNYCFRQEHLVTSVSCHLTVSLSTSVILVKFKVIPTRIPSSGFCRHCNNVQT